MNLLFLNTSFLVSILSKSCGQLTLWGDRGILQFCPNPGQAAWWSVHSISTLCLLRGMAEGGVPWLISGLPLLEATNHISLRKSCQWGGRTLTFSWNLSVIVESGNGTVPAPGCACYLNPDPTPDITLLFCLYFVKPQLHCKAKMEWLEFQKTSAYELSPLWVM